MANRSAPSCQAAPSGSDGSSASVTGAPPEIATFCSVRPPLAKYASQAPSGEKTGSFGSALLARIGSESELIHRAEIEKLVGAVDQAGTVGRNRQDATARAREHLPFGKKES